MTMTAFRYLREVLSLNRADMSLRLLARRLSNSQAVKYLRLRLILSTTSSMQASTNSVTMPLSSRTQMLSGAVCLMYLSRKMMAQS